MEVVVAFPQKWGGVLRPELCAAMAARAYQACAGQRGITRKLCRAYLRAWLRFEGGHDDRRQWARAQMVTGLRRSRRPVSTPLYAQRACQLVESHLYELPEARWRLLRQISYMLEGAATSPEARFMQSFRRQLDLYGQPLDARLLELLIQHVANRQQQAAERLNRATMWIVRGRK